jgi:hypothetical protein
MPLRNEKAASGLLAAELEIFFPAPAYIGSNDCGI